MSFCAPARSRLQPLLVSSLRKPSRLHACTPTRFRAISTKSANNPSSLMIDPRKSVFTKNAPDPIPGLYSQAVVANGVVYCSGNVAMDPKTNQIIEGDIQAHTHQIIKNLSEILHAAGSSINHVVKVNIFLADMGDFAKMNEVYDQYWGDLRPCRTCVAVKTLPLGTDIEIECTGVVIPKEI